MAWQLTEDLETFLTAAGGFLRARPAANTIMLTAAELLRAKGAATYGVVTPLFGWLASSDGSVEAAAAHAALSGRAGCDPLAGGAQPEHVRDHLVAGAARGGQDRLGVELHAHRPAAASSIAITAPSGVTAVTVNP